MTEDKEDSEVIKISIEPDSFKIQGRIPWEKKHTYILLAILCALLGISYEELSQVIGGMWNEWNRYFSYNSNRNFNC